MKRILWLTTLFLTSISVNSQVITDPSGLSKIFEYWHHSRYDYSTITITHSGDKTVAVRDWRKMTVADTAETTLHPFYLDTDSLYINHKGLVVTTAVSKKIWFVPFALGAKPVRIDQVPKAKSLKYYCNCGGKSQVENEPFCHYEVADSRIKCLTTEGLLCEEPGLEFCKGFAAVVVSEMTMETDENHLFYEGYTGGVFLEAASVEISNPTWYVPSRNSVMFIIDDNGKMMLKSDYDIYQEELKRKQQKD